MPPTRLPASDALTARHFRAFMAVMLNRTLAEAAYSLGVSQPAVSKALRLLEKETGLVFFRRVGGRLQPTEEAQRLLPHVQRALAQLDVARRVAYGNRGEAGGHVSIASSVPALLSLLPAAATSLIAERPGTTLEILPDTTTRGVIERVVDGQVDIGITNAPSHNVDSRLVQLCRSTPISEDLIVAVLPPGHSLAQRPVVRAADLHGETIVALPDDTPNSQLVNVTLQQARIDVKSPIICGNSLAVCALVAGGAGIGLINSLQFAEQAFANIVVKPFRPRLVLRTNAYMSRFEPPSDAAARFLALIVELRRRQQKRLSHG